jgi:hypothetical protein
MERFGLVEVTTEGFGGAVGSLEEIDGRRRGASGSLDAEAVVSLAGQGGLPQPLSRMAVAAHEAPIESVFGSNPAREVAAGREIDVEKRST